MSRSRNVTAGIFLPAVLDPAGIYRVPRNYSGIGQHLDLEFVDRYSAPLFRHCFARERHLRRKKIVLRYATRARR